MSKTLRPYQVSARDAVFSNLEKGIKSQLLVMATGTGKTFTAANILDRFKKILWITHTEELIVQSANSLEAELETFAGIIKRDKMDFEGRLTVASIQTLWRRVEKGLLTPDTFDCIVADEAHLAVAKTWFGAINHFDPKLVLGLTATPDRLDGIGLWNLFDEIAYEYSIGQGIQDGYLCQIDGIRVQTAVSLKGVRSVAGDFNQKDLAMTVNNPARNNLIVDSYEKYCKGRQGILYCVDIQHAVDVAETFQRRGYENVSFVVGDETLCPDRAERISLFKSGEIPILTNCQILTMGFDHPDVGWIGMACPTKSTTKYIQAVGRGTRLKDENFVSQFGQNMILLDFVDVSSRHRIVNAHELDKGKPIEEKVFVTEEKKEVMIAERAERRIDRVTDKDERVDLIQLPKWEVSKSPKMKEPATEKQLKWLKDLNYDVENSFFSKEDASMIISAQPASAPQVRALTYHGYDTSKGVTKGEAALAFDKITKAKEKKKQEEFTKQSGINGPVF